MEDNGREGIREYKERLYIRVYPPCLYDFCVIGSNVYGVLSITLLILYIFDRSQYSELRVVF